MAKQHNDNGTALTSEGSSANGAVQVAKFIITQAVVYNAVYLLANPVNVKPPAQATKEAERLLYLSPLTRVLALLFASSSLEITLRETSVSISSHVPLLHPEEAEEAEEAVPTSANSSPLSAFPASSSLERPIACGSSSDGIASGVAVSRGVWPSSNAAVTNGNTGMKLVSAVPLISGTS